MFSWIKSKIDGWGPDVFAGASYSTVFSLLKYMAEHFIDIFWSFTTMVVITIGHHYLKKWLKNK